MERSQLRSYLMKTMLGCLVAAAAVAVVTILIGDFNEVTGRALGTVFAALVHIILVFGLISITAPTSDASKRSSDAVVNATLAIAVLSFFTSVFAIWGILDGEIAGKAYVTYIIALFAIVHTKVLYDAQIEYKKVTPYVYANYVFIALVAILILGLVYLPNGSQLIGTFYGRLLAAVAIVDVTLSVVVAAMNRLYVQAHPELHDGQATQRFGAGRIVFVVLFFLFILGPILRLVL